MRVNPETTRLTVMLADKPAFQGHVAHRRLGTPPWVLNWSDRDHDTMALGRVTVAVAANGSACAFAAQVVAYASPRVTRGNIRSS